MDALVVKLKNNLGLQDEKERKLEEHATQINYKVKILKIEAEEFQKATKEKFGKLTL